MATTPKLSTDFSILVGGYAVAKATDFGLTVNKETIDITTLDALGWKAKLVDNKDWQLTFSGLVVRGTKDGLSDWLVGTTYSADDIVTYSGDNFIYISQLGSNIGNDPSTDDGTNWKKYLIDFSQLLEDFKESDDTIAFALTTATIGDNYQYGNGFLTSLDVSGSVGDKVTYSGTVEGTDALATGTVT